MINRLKCNSFINFNYKMDQDDLFFKDLIDFKDFRRKNEEFSSTNSKNSNKSQFPEGEIDFSNSDKLIKLFKELKDKIKELTKQNHSLREQMTSQQTQILRLHQSEKNLIAINSQLKQKCCHISLANDELKKTLVMMKESVKDKRSVSDEAQFMKSTVVELKCKIDQLSEQKKKIMEISIEEKITLEEELSKLKIKTANDQKYIKQMEEQANKIKLKDINLQNQLRKLQIKYQEEIFNQKWAKQHFEKEHWDLKVKEISTELKEAISKNKKQKEKRFQLQKRVLELQQMTGLSNVKAETYRGQASAMEKKMKKMQKKMKDMKAEVGKASAQKANWKQKFAKCAIISEELINRVKRELIGDAVQLAKSCQFKLNKLKQDNQRLPSRDKSVNLRKTNEKSKNKNNFIEEWFPNLNLNSSSTKSINANDLKILSQTTRPNQLNRENQQIGSNHLTFGNKFQTSLTHQYENIELKVRKERQQMQKKLREKIMIRKIDISSSPNKNKLRSQYMQYLFQK